MQVLRPTFAAAALAIAASCAIPAQAEIFLQAMSGADTVSVNDSSTPGAASYPLQTIGNFASSSTGFGFPDVGSTSHPVLDLGSSNSSASGGTLTLMLSETGFTTTTAATEFTSTLTGLDLNSSVVMSAYYDTSDAAFGTGSLLASNLSNGQSVSTLVPPITGPYSLTEIFTVTADANSLTSIDAAIIDAPEPGSASLLGAALLALGVLAGGRGALARSLPRA